MFIFSIRNLVNKIMNKGIKTSILHFKLLTLNFEFHIIKIQIYLEGALIIWVHEEVCKMCDRRTEIVYWDAGVSTRFAKKLSARDVKEFV